MSCCRNPGFKTVESELLDALVRADVVRPDHIEQPGLKVCTLSSSATIILIIITINFKVIWEEVALLDHCLGIRVVFREKYKTVMQRV